jgi:hypothetical protein
MLITSVGAGLPAKLLIIRHRFRGRARSYSSLNPNYSICPYVYVFPSFNLWSEVCKQDS